MYYLYNAESNSLIAPSLLVPMLRQFLDLNDAINWFDSLTPVNSDGSPANHVEICFEYHYDSRDEVIISHAKTLKDAVLQCPGAEYDIYIQGLDSFSFHLPVNCLNKFNAFFKPTVIQHDSQRRIQIIR